MTGVHRRRHGSLHKCNICSGLRAAASSRWLGHRHAPPAPPLAAHPAACVAAAAPAAAAAASTCTPKTDSWVKLLLSLLLEVQPNAMLKNARMEKQQAPAQAQWHSVGTCGNIKAP